MRRACALRCGDRLRQMRMQADRGSRRPRRTKSRPPTPPHWRRPAASASGSRSSSSAPVKPAATSRPGAREQRYARRPPHRRRCCPHRHRPHGNRPGGDRASTASPPRPDDARCWACASAPATSCARCSSSPRGHVAYCTERRLPWREDASNNSLAYARNAARSNLIPALRELHPPPRRTCCARWTSCATEPRVLDGLVATAGRAGGHAASAAQPRPAAPRRCRRLAGAPVGARATRSSRWARAGQREPRPGRRPARRRRVRPAALRAPDHAGGARSASCASSAVGPPLGDGVLDAAACATRPDRARLARRRPHAPARPRWLAQPAGPVHRPPRSRARGGVHGRWWSAGGDRLVPGWPRASGSGSRRPRASVSG